MLAVKEATRDGTHLQERVSFDPKGGTVTIHPTPDRGNAAAPRVKFKFSYAITAPSGTRPLVR
jgi:hypothetical protein